MQETAQIKQTINRLIWVAAITAIAAVLALEMVKSTLPIGLEKIGFIISVGLLRKVYRGDNFSRQAFIVLTSLVAMPFCLWFGIAIASIETRVNANLLGSFGVLSAIVQVVLALYLLKPETRELFVSAPRSQKRQHIIHIFVSLTAILFAGCFVMGLIVGFLRGLGFIHQ